MHPQQEAFELPASQLAFFYPNDKYVYKMHKIEISKY